MPEASSRAARALRADFRFAHALRVRWAEVDMQKIVFNAHYLMYFDTAISDYWRTLALPYEASMRALGGDLYVKKASLEYHASARMDDRLDVALRCARIGTSSMTFQGAAFRDGVPLVECELVYVFADPQTQKALPVPQALRQALLGFEAGQDPVALHTGAWDGAVQEGARALRTEVFVREQGIPVHEEWDAADATALHAVARNRLGQPVATGRLLAASPTGVGRIGRMAVLQPLRGAGLGRAVLDALIAAARARGDRAVLLHAQRSAEGFYAARGFMAQGAPFDEVGIAHIEMVKALL